MVICLWTKKYLLSNNLSCWYSSQWQFDPIYAYKIYVMLLSVKCWKHLHISLMGSLSWCNRSYHTALLGNIRLHTALKIEEIEEFECFYTSKSLREIPCENTRLSKEFLSLTSKKAAARVCYLSLIIAVSQLPPVKIRKCISLWCSHLLRLPVKVQIVISCRYQVCVII